jgi:predicted SAM-dependent methyltransferase
MADNSPRGVPRQIVGSALDHMNLRGVYHQVRAFVATEAGKHRLRRAVGSTPLRIVVGSGGVVENGWVNTERAFLDLLCPDRWEAYFGKHKIDAILAEHVWEHLTPSEGVIAARTCRRYLRPGGYLRIAVPDGNHPDQEYIRHVKPGGVGPGADDHKVLYDYRLLSRTMSQAGLRVELLEYFDENGRFVFNPWNTSDGMIHRSSRYDERNRDGKLNYTSLIMDAWAP